MRLLLVLVGLALLSAPAVLAEGNATTNSTNETTNTTTTNTTATNATVNETNTTPTAPAGPIEISLDGHGDGAGFYWTLRGATERNPTLSVQPGQHVTFHVRSVTSLHNIKIGDDKVSAIINEGDSLDVEWTAPTEPGTVTYICVIHGKLMSGTIQVGAPKSGGSGAGTIQGDSIDLGDYGFPDCKGTMVPAIVAKQVAGGPTLADYGAHCKTNAAVARPASGADYVIPASFAFIALGIVGVVWVHRSYKP